MHKRSTTTQAGDQTRAESLRVATVAAGERTVTAIIATARKVAVYDAASTSIIDEVLVMSGVDLPDQAPLLAEHFRSLSAAMGSVRSIRIDGERLLGTLHFGESAAADEVWPLVRDRHIIDVSVGYRVLEATDIPAGRTRTITGQQFTAGPRPLRVTTKWRLLEVSLVVIGADEAAKIRSADPFIPSPDSGDSRTMVTITRTPRDTLPDLVAAAFNTGHARAADLTRSALRHMGHDAPQNDADCIREAMSTPDIASAFDSAIGTAVLSGYDENPDTTAGWTSEVSLPDFRPASLFTAAMGDRLDRIGRGDQAGHLAFGFSEAAWRLARYGKQLVVDEQDLLSDRLGVIREAAAEMGRAARRVKLDLVFALLLRNPEMSDDIALFHTDHGNLSSGGDSAMGDTGLAAGLAAVAGQVLEDEDGDPVHLGLAGRYLLVPPPIIGTARRAARAIQLADGHDLVVRAESRLSATGVVDPVDGEGVQGTSTNWLLTADSSAWPSVVIGGLNGPPRPRVRRGRLDQGEWGACWDVKLDIAAAVADHRGLYFSAGA